MSVLRAVYRSEWQTYLFKLCQQLSLGQLPQCFPDELDNPRPLAHPSFVGAQTLISSQLDKLERVTEYFPLPIGYYTDKDRLPIHSIENIIDRPCRNSRRQTPRTGIEKSR